jgi:hypothetical protein
MDVLAFTSRLTDSERTRMIRQGLCFQCGDHGHISKNCPSKGNNQPKARIDTLEEDVCRLTEQLSKVATSGRAEGSKNGGAQE